MNEARKNLEKYRTKYYQERNRYYRRCGQKKDESIKDFQKRQNKKEWDAYEKMIIALKDYYIDRIKRYKTSKPSYYKRMTTYYERWKDLRL